MGSQIVLIEMHDTCNVRPTFHWYFDWNLFIFFFLFCYYWHMILYQFNVRIDVQNNIIVYCELSIYTLWSFVVHLIQSRFCWTRNLFMVSVFILSVYIEQMWHIKELNHMQVWWIYGSWLFFFLKIDWIADTIFFLHMTHKTDL